MKVYCAWYCPFAQRAWMTLLLKEIDFEYIEVDPYQKSEWWLAVSRNEAKVPVIVAANDDGLSETTIIDSSRIVEYLEDVAPNVHPLFPQTPNERAEHRYWMDHINQAIVPYVYRFLEAEEDNDYREDSKNKMLSGLKKVAEAMSDDGPFFAGETLSAMDILLAPFAYRIDALLAHYRDFTLPKEGEHWARYHQWYQAVLDHPIFKATATDHDNYRQRLIEFYLPYSKGEGQKDVTRVD